MAYTYISNSSLHLLVYISFTLIKRNNKLYFISALNMRLLFVAENWVIANHNHPAVASMSLGGGASQASDDGVMGMINAGIPVAVAAGNEDTFAGTKSPARTRAVSISMVYEAFLVNAVTTLHWYEKPKNVPPKQMHELRTKGVLSRWW